MLSPPPPIPYGSVWAANSKIKNYLKPKRTYCHLCPPPDCTNCYCRNFVTCNTSKFAPLSWSTNKNLNQCVILPCIQKDIGICMICIANCPSLLLYRARYSECYTVLAWIGIPMVIIMNSFLRLWHVGTRKTDWEKTWWTQRGEEAHPQPRPNWDPPSPLPQASVSPPEPKRCTHSPAVVEVVGSNSDEWRKSLALRLLCEPNHKIERKILVLYNTLKGQ